METVAKTHVIPKSTDRILEALATLAALLDRTINEVRSLEGNFQSQLLEAVQKTEEALQVKTAESVEHARTEVQQELTGRFQTELQAGLDTLRTDFQAERARLTAEFGTERQHLENDLRQAGDTASSLQDERAKLLGELQHAKERVVAEIEKAGAAAGAPDVPQGASYALPALATEEIARIEAKLAELLRLIDDPATELSVVMRKNVEKLELEAYLKGLRYAATGEGR